ncbi:type II CRISPR RNA-guided endonuclease Cas9 [Oenococcus kitaharae]|uniref:CRISPR-associated endonuclease Cas9 n=1 Tax=Oenococcus kitaharae DSM 17330 TaxID=1045004 RepID=G9WGU4_9LACO|nr:type II CRISPR RNA-guided endonuclease Cas9 [Oenococcus kitaharae]EHN59352.1 CRISPR-associated protein [Oenococcus kitaharae DSM 17330]OEY82138.1 hypothetical protein NT96_06980 [Oenococcus kitaharae]OEY82561.1 hypothetical protein NV75_07425 [Oenococcus kitaharae]OEY84816.1 hypothetical protein NT95_00020 [Oenococcus kitaharae]
MARDYSVGLDIGTSSVGWAAIDNKYHLIRAKSKNLIGVRLFDSAVTAEKRRGYRTTRRRLSRRHWRLRLLNDIFAGPLTDFGDENFLARLKYSWVHPQDQSNQAHFAAGLLFDSKEQDKDFYRKYPTIYHLRLALMNDDQKHDLREVYLAIHHLVKYRGHFLIEGDVKADSAFDVHTFADAIQRYAESNNSDENLLGKIDEKKLSAALTDKHGSKSQRAETAETAFDILDLQSKKQIQAILKSVVGNQANLMAIFGLDSSAISKDEQKNYKFSFDDADIDEKIADSEALLSDTEFEFLCDLKAAFDGLTLKMLLGDDKTVSAAMVRRFNEHQKDWEYIKSHIRNAKNAGNGLYEKSKKFDGINAAYLALQSDNEDDRKKAKKIFQDEISSADIPDDVKADFLKKIDDDQFLPIQRTKNNGTIPHQLHRNELEQIIEKQGIYYPFLKDTYQENSHELNKITALINFRVPYYVGPLVEEEQKIADDGKNIPDPTNHWMVRKSNDTITPWNLSQVVDLDKSGRRFIERLTGTDTYLIGEPTLPKNSLLYQKFDVLQELNNIRVSGRRLDIRAKQDAFEHLFKVQKTVSATNLKDFLVQAGYISEDTQIEGLADVNGKNFNNALTTYNYLVSVLGREFVENPSNEELLEEITELQTVFEDKKVLRRQLDQLDGLSDHNREKLSRKHYTGWGRISKKLLTTKIVQNADKIDNQTFDVPRMNQSIIDTLYNTKMNLMEIINNAEDDFGVRAWIDKQNTTDGDEQDVYSLIDELAGPKEIKRGIVQSFRILDDITKAVGYAPKRVYLEFARKTQESHLTNSRKNQLSTLLKNAGLSELVTQVSQYDAAALQNDRLYLYFLQQGKDMYSGEKLNLDNLSNYDIDHIIPQAYTKDNSLDNRVLVSNITNRRKSDSSNYLPALIDKMRPFWSVLSKQGLLSKHKFANLTRTRDFDDMEKERFIARSLVETRQIIKNVASLIDSHFGGETKAVAIRSSLTADMRRYVDIPKNRDINDYHHAFDALLFSTVGQYTENSGLMKKGQLSDSAGNQYNRYIKEWIHAARLNAQSQRVNPFGFVVGSMRNAAPGKLNPETGEITPEENADWSIADLDYLHKVMNFRKITVTRRLKDQKGQLYDESRYPSVLHDAKSKASINFDKHKPVDLYGGFSSAKPAYAALIKFKNKFRLVNVLRQWTYSDKNSEDYILEQIRGKYPKAEMVLSHIPYGQLVKKDGALVTISSATELHNFEQLWLPLADYKLINTLLKTKEDNLVDILHNRLDLPEMTIESAFYKAFDSILSFAFNRYALHQNALVKLQAHRDDFNALNYEDKQQTLERILDALHASPASSDLKKINLSSGFGRLFSPSHFTLADTDEFIFQSVTGLFSTQKTVAQLYQETK